MITFLRKFGQSAVSLFQGKVCLLILKTLLYSDQNFAKKKTHFLGVRIIMTGATFPTNFDAYIRYFRN